MSYELLLRAYRRFTQALSRRLDVRNDIDTTQVVRLQDLGLDHEEREDYYPTPWRTLQRVLRQDEVKTDDVFLDMGCGKGRILYQAATYPFRKVIGVEISPDLAAAAKANIARALRRLECRNIEIVTSDVVAYEVPDEVTFVYFFDPFHGAIFSAALDRIFESLRRRPRQLTVIYHDPHEEAMLLERGARLVKTAQALRPTRRWASARSIRMYRLDPQGSLS